MLYHATLLLLTSGRLIRRTGAITLAAFNWSLGTFIIVSSFTFYTFVNFSLLILVTLPGAVFTSLANRIRGGPSDHPKRKRKRLTFSAWLSNLIAPLPFLPHHLTDLLPVRGVVIPLPEKRWFSVAGDASGGRRCIACGKLFSLERRQHACRRRFDALGNSSPAHRMAALNWARMIDIVAELGRFRPLPTLDFDHDKEVLQATSMAMSVVFRVILDTGVDDLAGWHLFALFHILVFSPTDMEMFKDSVAYKEHILNNCDHIATGKWLELLTEANAAAAAAERAGAGRRHGAARVAGADARNDARLPIHVMRLIREGKLGKALEKMRSAFRPAAAPSGAALLAEMQKKHPPAKAAIPDPPADLPRFTLAYTSFTAAIHSLKDGKSPGADGLSDGLLRRILLEGSQDGQFCLDAAFVLSSVITAGRCSKAVGHVLMISELMGIPKKVGDGEPPAARPIGLNTSFRKLAFASAMTQVSDRVASFYSPLQYGAAEGGVDAAILTARRMASILPNCPVCLLDLYNAWNEGLRSATLANLIASPFADLAHMYSVTYGQECVLILRHRDFNDGFVTIPSCEGSTQGCKWAALLFGILTMPTFLAIFGPGGPFHLLILLIAYADDLKLRCISADRRRHFSDMAACVSLLETELGKLGFRVVNSKSFASLLIESPGTASSLAPQRGRLTDDEWRLRWPHIDGAPLRLVNDGYRYLGAPFSSVSPDGNAFLRNFYEAIVGDMLQDMMMVAATLPDERAAAWRLLVVCILPRFSFLLRCSAPSRILLESASIVDLAAQRFFLSSLRLSCGDTIADLRQHLSLSHVNAIEAQLALPPDDGGLGIHSMRLGLAPACLSVLRSYDQASLKHLRFHGVRAASFGDFCAQAFRLATQLHNSIPLFSHAFPAQLATLQHDDQASLQFAVYSTLRDRIASGLRDDPSCIYDGISQNRQQAARVISLSFETTKAGYGWLQLWWQLDNRVWTSACISRLGIPPQASNFFGKPVICRGVITCAARLDPYLLHLWACNTAVRSYLHHGLIRWLAMYIEATGANIRMDYELPGVVGINNSRPGDLILYGTFIWLVGSDDTTSRAIIVDLMVPQPCVKSTVTTHGSDRFGGAATRAGADGKRRAFAAKIQNDPNVVRLHQSWIFRPWIVTPFGDMNPEMLEDLTGIANMIAAHRLRGCFDAASRERAERKELANLLTAFSCAIQREVHDFLDSRINACL